ncbi:MAG: hypothetical protein ACLSEX_12215, partial [Blautia sp.]
GEAGSIPVICFVETKKVEISTFLVFFNVNDTKVIHLQETKTEETPQAKPVSKLLYFIFHLEYKNREDY